MPSYTLEDTAVPFPYEAYDAQLALMSAALRAVRTGQHALLESPTGTGKTLSMLCATLAWQAAARNTEGAGPLVVYASRTHAQLGQVVRELRKTAHRPRMRLAAARDRLCSNERVRRAAAGRGGAAHAAMCASLVRRGQCERALATPGAQRALEEARAAGDPGAAVDIEDAGRVAEAHGACGYFVARGAGRPELALVPYNYLFDRRARASVLAVDVLEPSSARGSRPDGRGFEGKPSIGKGSNGWSSDGHGSDGKGSNGHGSDGKGSEEALRGAVVVIDEAHNVEGVCAEAASASLAVSDVRRALAELRRVEATLGDGPAASGENAPPGGASAASVAETRAVLAALEGAIGDVPDEPAPGERVFAVLAAAGMTAERAWPLLQTLARAARAHAEHVYRSGAAGAEDAGGRAGGLAAVEAALAAVWRPAGTDECPALEGPEDARCFRVFGESLSGTANASAYGKNTKSTHAPNAEAAESRASHARDADRRMVYWCCSPALAMRDLVRTGVRAILLCSGTLAPLASFSAELGLVFAPPHEGAHVVPAQNTLARVLPAVGGVALRGSFSVRATPAYQDAVGAALLAVITSAPAGVLVFFASQPVLAACLARWRTTGLYSKLAAAKPVVVESAARSEAAAPRRPADGGQDAFAAHAANVRTRGASLLLAVCRGRASEGADFADGLARAVVVVGVPYPPLGDPRVRLKRAFLDARRAPAIGQTRHAPHSTEQSQALSGDAWYELQAARAVNQAVGRVIRHARDHGAVVLLDDRYATPRAAAQLPRWLRPVLAPCESLGALEDDLGVFFARFPAETPALGEALPAPSVQRVLPATDTPLARAREAVAEACAFFTRRAAPDAPLASAPPSEGPLDSEPCARQQMRADERLLVGEVLQRVPAHFNGHERMVVGGAQGCVSAHSDSTDGQSICRDLKRVPEHPDCGAAPSNTGRDAERLLADVRALLSERESSAFSDVVRAHRRGALDTDAVLERVRPLLEPHGDLFARFCAFLPRPKIASVRPPSPDAPPKIATLSNTSETLPTKSKPSYTHDALPTKLKPPHAVQETSHRGDDTTSAKRPPSSPILDSSPRAGESLCAVCQGAPTVPTAARCGHVCCYPCWMVVLQKSPRCPVCAGPTRIPHLRRLP